LRSGRFDYIVHCEKPDATDRSAIIRLCCRQVPLARDVVDGGIEDLAVRTEGLTGADLESLCKKATLLAIAEFHKQRSGAPFVVSRHDFDAVLNVHDVGADPRVRPRADT
jgi:transitional endoplasmic reticulum ATPase